MHLLVLISHWSMVMKYLKQYKSVLELHSQKDSHLRFIFRQINILQTWISKNEVLFWLKNVNDASIICGDTQRGQYAQDTSDLLPVDTMP